VGDPVEVLILKSHLNLPRTVNALPVGVKKRPQGVYRLPFYWIWRPIVLPRLVEIAFVLFVVVHSG